MELSPKQQTIELVKKANRILILGHRDPEGDLLGSSLALTKSLCDLGKTVELVVTGDIPSVYKFLPYQKSISSDLNISSGKVLRIDTNKAPITGMKYKKSDGFLDVILESDKNLKFEFIEIINGTPKPDLILILDTPDVEKIDKSYDANTEIFFEVPIVNIDHHPGNEYFGTVNLVDLTASSTAEILVSLLEALGVKIADPDTATCLLLGIISDTQSFRSQSTTPKSLTVAAQLLAAGARQQEIISNLYKKRPMALLQLWGEMLSGISLDKNHRFAWTKVKVSDVAEKGISSNDILDAADELLSNTQDADTILILCETKEGEILGKIKGAKGTNVLPMAKLFMGDGVPTNANFVIKNTSLLDAEKKTLKQIYDFWGENGSTNIQEKEVWDVIEKDDEKLSIPETEEEIEETIPDINELTPPQTEEEKEITSDVIDTALESLSSEQANKENTLAPIKSVIEKKVKDLGINPKDDVEIDVFDEDNDK
jgi:nanoRNase/pAp phosphatase (c-di-AMP/oligoRNAs hydrolase)